MSNACATPILDHSLADRLDAAWGDPAVWLTHGLQWTHLQPVVETVNRQISGNSTVSSLDWFVQRVGVSTHQLLERVLVLGCGHGRVERDLMSKGWAREVVATDLSPQVLDHARASAAREGLNIRYQQADMNQLPVGLPGFERGSFDAVLGVACVHHCKNLEQLYADVAALLKPDGWFFLDEYVGPDRFQFGSDQVRYMNQLLDLLPESLRLTRDGRVKGNLRPPTVEEVVSVDPSEAVRSSELLALLETHFDVHERRPYGGVLLRVILADIAQNFMGPAARPYLSALLAAEQELLCSGRLAPDLVCVMAQPRAAASQSSTPGR